MCSITADDALASIEVGLDALAGAEPEIVDPARLEKIRRLVAAGNRITALVAGAVRDAETHRSSEHDGLKSIKSWLRTHPGCRGRQSAALSGRAARRPCCPPSSGPSWPVS